MTHKDAINSKCSNASGVACDSTYTSLDKDAQATSLANAAMQDHHKQ